MTKIHFLNVLEGDTNIIEHDSGRVSLIDISNAYNDYDTEEEKAVKNSQARKDMLSRTQVPSDKKDYHQKKEPDNPIYYMKEKNIKDIFRFIVTHPDMDHLDGIKDLFEEFNIINFWDTDNKKEISDKANSGGYNLEDWKFYKKMRDSNPSESPKRLTYFAKNINQYYDADGIQILAPTPSLLGDCNEIKNWNDSSYVILFTPKKTSGEKCKILFAGDSEDKTWNYILENHSEDVKDVDVLFAPHHGRDSGRSYEFLKIVNPTVTLFGNASSKHLAYSKYNSILKITNNQAGYVIMKITDKIYFYVKNYEFARDYRYKQGWSEPTWNTDLEAYFLCNIK